MSKIAVFFVDGFEEIEGLTVVDLCRRAGIEVDMVSMMERKEVMGAHQIPVCCELMFDDIDKDSYDMVVLPGGAGHKKLEAHDGLMALVDAYFKADKYVAAICASPSILGRRGILKGKKACCFPSFEEHLQGAEVSFDNVCVDGKVITSRSMGTSIDFALAIIEALEGAELADKKAKEIVYR
ncbi:MAG: DJ-1/PfpI family protein [Lachnospiraceae bacterium]|nr:DJ-1/PfpI family protein [Lachnospiraceae bacterium]